MDITAANELPLPRVKKSISKPLRFLYEFLFYLCLFVFALVFYIVITPLFNTPRNGVVAQSFTILLLAILGGVFYYLKKNERVDQKTILLFMILVGYFIRLGYILYTPGSARQHDTWSTNYDGHFAYADIIFTTGALPTTNAYQFYHPPLNSLIDAGFMHVFEGITSFVNSHMIWLTGGIGLAETHEAYFSACQVLTLMYSTLIMEFAIRSFSRLKLKGSAFYLASAFICFFPRFIQLSGQLNNDILTIMLSFAGVYFTLRWKDTDSWLDIILIAVTIGLSMMTKLSGAVVCLPIAVLFIWKFIQVIKNKNGLVRTIMQFIVFLAICAPLGLWFQVYAKIRFDQSFGFVFGNLNDALSVSQYNFFERFLTPFAGDLFNNGIFCNAFEDYNLFTYTMKSAIFGEFSFWQGEGFGFLAVVSNYLVTLSTIVLFVILAFKKKFNLLSKEWVFAWTMFLAFVFSQLFFNIKMPYGCTMDFRYMVPIVLPMGYLIGSIDEQLRAMSKGYQITGRVYRYSVYAFLGSSMLFYMVCI